MYDLDDYNVQIVVECNDKNVWTLQPFFRQFEKYFNTPHPPYPYHVIGYSHPPFAIPLGWQFISLAPENIPAERWTEGISHYLNYVCKKTLVIFLLSDYWFVRRVDDYAVSLACNMAYYDEAILRVDLTHDRQGAQDARDRGYFDRLDIIETPHLSPYQMSFQAGVWRRDNFARVLKPGISAWDAEYRIRPHPSYHVYGTKQCPMRYANALRESMLDTESLSKLDKEDYDEVMKFVPEGVEKMKPGEAK